MNHICIKSTLDFDCQAIDDWNYSPEHQQQQLRQSIETLPFNEVFDLVQFVLRHGKCPAVFIKEMKDAFVTSRLAYAIDDGPPPTIIPSVTVEEGKTILESMQTLREAGLGGSAAQLRKAAECINGQDWAGSVRESIHAVESVARQLDPKGSTALGPALAALRRGYPFIRRSRRHSPNFTGTHRMNRAFGMRSWTKKGQTWGWMRRCSCWEHALPSPAICGGNMRRGRNDVLTRVVGG